MCTEAHNNTKKTDHHAQLNFMDVDNNYLFVQTYMYSYLLVDSNSIYGINGDIILTNIMLSIIMLMVLPIIPVCLSLMLCNCAYEKYDYIKRLDSHWIIIELILMQGNQTVLSLLRY